MSSESLVFNIDVIYSWNKMEKLGSGLTLPRVRAYRNTWKLASLAGLAQSRVLAVLPAAISAQFFIQIRVEMIPDLRWLQLQLSQTLQQTLTQILTTGITFGQDDLK